MSLPVEMTAAHWMTHIFSAKAAREGGIVRRKLRGIERYLSREEFEDKLRRRGFHAIENAGQLVIFCTQEAAKIIR